MLLIIDNQSQYIRQFKRRYLDDRDIPHLIFEHNEQINFSKLPEISGLMISGGKGNPYEPLNLTTNFVALMNLDVPTIGFCLGHEIIGVAWQAKIKRLRDYQNKKQLVNIDVLDDPIFAGLGKSDFIIQKRHRYHLPAAPLGFVVLAHSDICPVEVIRHFEKPIYGFQGHPEVSGKDGLLMVNNFIGMCGLL
ncbi:MAG: gamma-glutamyl-gamma-aminobutyrate hydrolase family protein [Candidatus Thiodiazotropha sp. 'RUGA']|nr:gamma-glutamyl-gamma-aminobutyrate hydrolase family protein [Candidatus Thiodiazotropha lotti]MCG8018126.1 gamma-glutamyl-gamma-aminobutyrate hydrolase family protein [Candidatus Thiodiazotropha sp. 'RUGA']MCG8002981.1 gamma-glutamyl-gamma-aminobutyrate hydrolase family protein [Candidatus Thiodiazotropha lotti]MCG8008609.1 gamma-glutamyl-gamma-aminobutyrate hydrolase family protein [Candidatus Thiodiazotropha lotti]MCW4186602.1 gamma-glutamyl-gamma-aminobutyrate hydrolase family protein [Ca